MQTDTQSRPAWWDDTAPIPMAAGPSLDDTQIVVRGQGPIARGRSEYAELAELAAAHGPRDTRAMLAEARRVGELLGTRAYYDFPAGGGRVTGPTIDLMDALAIVWGRLVARVEILDETRDRVHLRGRVVDLLALTAVERDYMSAIAPAPGNFAKKPDQADRWRVMQLQSASSKAIRGALEHALPTWLTDAALDAARQAAAREATGGKPLPEARSLAAAHLARSGLDRPTLEIWVGAAYDLWTADELGRLRTLAGQLSSGQVAPEAIRAQVAQAGALAPAAEPTGRLAGLGLGNPGPAPAAPAVQQSTPSSPQPAASEAPPATEPAARHGGEAPASGGPSPKAPPANPEADAQALRAVIGARTGEIRVADVADSWKAALGLLQLRSSRVAEAIRWGSLHNLWTATWDPAGRALTVTTTPAPKVADHRSPARRELEATIADLERDLGAEAVEAARREVDLGLRASLDAASTEQLERYQGALERQLPEPGSDDGEE